MTLHLSALRRLVPAFAAALLAACSSLGLETDKIDYKAVDRQKPLDIPPDLTQLPSNDRFTVPGVVSASQVQNQPQLPGQRPAVAPATGGAATAPTTVGTGGVAGAGPVARIERSGSQRWLLVNLPPEKTFEEVVDFWRSVGLGVERQDPQTGIVETVWAENRAKLPQDIIRSTIGRVFDFAYSTGEQDKYRARIERSPAGGTSEVFISHRGMVEVHADNDKSTTRWQPRPADPELEAEMLQRLAVRLNKPADAKLNVAADGKTTAVATGPAAPDKARIVASADGRNVQLQVDEPFDRAWRRVGLALDRGGFTVEDRDRNKGFYLVRYLDPDEEAKQRQKQGFFSRLFGSDPKIQAPQFRIQVTDAGTRSEVTVLDGNGNPTLSSAVDRIMTLLRDQLRV
jgi:outer membrane protein assembly factor BamC